MSKNILVIDDEESVRNSFLLALEQTGFNVDTADNGSAGLEKFQGGEYHLVFLDLKMPVMDGSTTLRRIRELDRSVPIYIVTAFHQEYFAELKAAKNEGSDFEILHKPVAGDDIRMVVASVLDGRNIQEEDFDG